MDGSAPRSELQDLQLKSQQVTDDVSYFRTQFFLFFSLPFSDSLCIPRFFRPSKENRKILSTAMMMMMMVFIEMLMMNSICLALHSRKSKKKGKEEKDLSMQRRFINFHQKKNEKKLASSHYIAIIIIIVSLINRIPSTFIVSRLMFVCLLSFLFSHFSLFLSLHAPLSVRCPDDTLVHL